MNHRIDNPYLYIFEDKTTTSNEKLSLFVDAISDEETRKLLNEHSNTDSMTMDEIDKIEKYHLKFKTYILPTGVWNIDYLETLSEDEKLDWEENYLYKWIDGIE